MKRICKQCGKEFELSDNEIRFYKSKGLELPKRCQSCRDQNKKQKGKEQVPTKASSSTDKTLQSNAGNGSRKNAVIIAASVFLFLFAFVIKNIFSRSSWKWIIARIFCLGRNSTDRRAGINLRGIVG